jgi:hypothetical protein
MKSLDLFIEEGFRLLDDSGNPVNAYSAHDRWAQEVQQWLSENETSLNLAILSDSPDDKRRRNSDYTEQQISSVTR